MRLDMSVEQARDLDALLQASLREMSHEIAATDNAGYRSTLVARRGRLAEVRDLLQRQLDRGESTGVRVHDAVALEQDLAHPGG